MRRVVPVLLAAFLASPSPADDAKPSFTTDVRPLFEAYCFECHNPTKRKAGLDLKEIDTDAAAVERGEAWDLVGERVAAKEMPPGKSKPPTDDERKRIVDWVKGMK